MSKIKEYAVSLDNDKNRFHFSLDENEDVAYVSYKNEEDLMLGALLMSIQSNDDI